MATLITLGFFLFSVSLCTAWVSSTRWKCAHLNNDPYVNPYHLSFSAGDVLECKFSGFLDHVMLALDSKHVAHVFPDSKRSTRASLRQDNFAERMYQKGLRCRKITRWFDCYFRESFNETPYSWRVAVSRAKRSTTGSPNVYYDYWSCNCEHWVTSWKYGTSYSTQASFPDSNCPIYSTYG